MKIEETELGNFKLAMTLCLKEVSGNKTDEQAIQQQVKRQNGISIDHQGLHYHKELVAGEVCHLLHR